MININFIKKLRTIELIFKYLSIPRKAKIILIIVCTISEMIKIVKIYKCNQSKI